MSAEQTTITVLVIIVLNIPLYFWIARQFFRDLADFGECVFFWLKPDILSWVDGTLRDDFAGTLRLLGWIGLCALITFLEVVMILALLDRFLVSGGV